MKCDDHDLAGVIIVGLAQGAVAPRCGLVPIRKGEGEREETCSERRERGKERKRLKAC